MTRGIECEPFGLTAGGDAVALFTMRNATGVEVRVLTYGGIIVSLKTPDRDGRLADVVLGFDSLPPYATQSHYFGAIIGRYANRIARGRFTLDGRTHRLATNDGPNHLHGGDRGFDKAVWEAVPFDHATDRGLTLRRTSPAGEEGYPGTLRATVTYTLTDENELAFDYLATTDEATPVNLTQHSYFNLAGAGSGDVLDQELTITASAFTVVDPSSIPTGELRAVDGTPFDFRTPTAIGARMEADDPQMRVAPGYDHNFVLDRGGIGLELAARMTDPEAGVRSRSAPRSPGSNSTRATSWTVRSPERAVGSTHVEAASASRPSIFRTHRTGRPSPRRSSGLARSTGAAPCWHSAWPVDPVNEGSDTMTKAIRFHEKGGPEVLRLDEVEVGDPGPGELRLKHTAIGVNFVDTYQRSGLYAVPLPGVAGNEAAGVVEAVGDGVAGFAVGDRVAYTGLRGAYCEERLAPADRVVKIPDGVSDEQAASMLLKGMTVQYLIHRTYAVKAGETVLWHAAAGGVGLIACQWLDALGVTVIGTAGTEEKAAIAAAHGCTHPVVYTRESFVDRVLEITKGEKLPVVYDSVGASTWEGSLDCLRPRGLMVSFGNASGAVPPVSIGILAAKGSLYVTRPTLATHIATRAELEETAASLFRVVRSGTVRIVTTRRYPLAEAAQAHRDLEGRRTTGSVILVP